MVNSNKKCSVILIINLQFCNVNLDVSVVSNNLTA